MKQRYNAKAKDSFKTKLNLYLFKNAFEDSWHQFSQNDFVQFEIDDELVRKHTAVYWQYELDYPITENNHPSFATSPFFRGFRFAINAKFSNFDGSNTFQSFNHQL
jgi:hypothetical protein